MIVLVDPQMGENIGAAARAMLNFGLTGLRIVRPRDGWPNERAAAMAAGASIVIEQAQVFDTVEEAVADCHHVLATTARSRDLLLPVETAEEAGVTLRTRIGDGQRCAVLFGGERSGLTADDVARAQAILTIPVNPDFASLNLGQAVLLVAYEWSRQAAAVKAFDGKLDERGPAERHMVEGLYEQLDQALDDAGYYFPEEKRARKQRNLRTLVQRAEFTESEVATLRGAITALTKGRV